MSRTIKTRDYNMVNIIRGVTKAAVHLDRRKAADYSACRTFDWRLDDEHAESEAGEDAGVAAKKGRYYPDEWD